MLNKIRRFLVELMFEAELDQDYWMGCREGAESAKKTLAMQLQLLHDQAPKSKQPGIMAAIEQVRASE